LYLAAGLFCGTKTHERNCRDEEFVRLFSQCHVIPFLVICSGGSSAAAAVPPGETALLEHEHGRGLVYVPYVLLTVGTEADGRDIREQCAVPGGLVLLLEFQRAQDAVEIYDT